MVSSRMKKLIKNMLIAALTLGVTSVSGQRMKVADFDKADFQQLTTFRVVQGDLSFSGEETPISKGTFYEWVKEYVRRDLEARGYIFTEDSMADFRIDYVAGTYNVNTNENLGQLGGTPATDPSMMNQSRYYSESVKEGLLVLQIYKGRSQTLLWEAEGSVNLNPGQAERVLAGMISKAFRKFPKAETQ